MVQPDCSGVLFCKEDELNKHRSVDIYSTSSFFLLFLLFLQLLYICGVDLLEHYNVQLSI